MKYSSESKYGVTSTYTHIYNIRVNLYSKQHTDHTYDSNLLRYVHSNYVYMYVIDHIINYRGESGQYIDIGNTRIIVLMNYVKRTLGLDIVNKFTYVMDALTLNI